MSNNTVGSVGLYLVNGTGGKIGTPGAPLLKYSLLVNAVTGAITGQAVQTQALAAPYNEIHISNITGQVRATGLGSYTKVVTLTGSAVISFPPPAIGSYLAPFSAHIAVDNAWNGVGGWTLGNTNVENVPFHEDK